MINALVKLIVHALAFERRQCTSFACVTVTSHADQLRTFVPGLDYHLVSSPQKSHKHLSLEPFPSLSCACFFMHSANMPLIQSSHSLPRWNAECKLKYRHILSSKSSFFADGPLHRAQSLHGRQQTAAIPGLNSPKTLQSSHSST
jgi:hypothetical protein